jgi:hypothetical protein
MHYCLRKLYFGSLVKKNHYIVISENCHKYGFLRHIKGIIKAKAHKQIKQSDCVLFLFLKIFLKNATNIISFGSYGVERGMRENLNHSVMERG